MLVTALASGNIASGVGYNLLVGAGRDDAVPTLLYEGLIDEARIYNYALTASQVTDLYVPVATAPTIAYSSEEISVCEGNSYNGWTTAGEYQRTLLAVNGADSIVTTYLTINPIFNTYEEIVIKEGEIILAGHRPASTKEILRRFLVATVLLQPSLQFWQLLMRLKKFRM